MSTRCLCERRFLADHGAQGTVFEACKNPSMDVRLFLRSDTLEHQRANRGAATHQFTRIDGNFAATADDDHATVVGQKFRVVGEVNVGEHFQNDVHSAATSCSQNLFLISGFSVIKNFMGARAVYTRSPRLTLLTLSPIASTTPAPSDPGV